MRVRTKRVLAAMAGLAVVLIGTWIGGFEWERGAESVFLYIGSIAAAGYAAIFPFRSDE